MFKKYLKPQYFFMIHLDRFTC